MFKKNILLFVLISCNLFSFSQSIQAKQKISKQFYDLPIDASFEMLKDLILKDTSRFSAMLHSDSTLKEVYVYLNPLSYIDSCRIDRLILRVDSTDITSLYKNTLFLNFSCESFSTALLVYEKLNKDYKKLFSVSKEKKNNGSGKTTYYYAKRFDKKPKLSIRYQGAICMLGDAVHFVYYR